MTDAAAALTKPRIISELCRSPHGALAEYVPVGARAAAEDPEFYAHLVAWDAEKGQVRDAHVALPVIALAPQPMLALLASAMAEECVENALAHLAALTPRQFTQAVSFWRDQRAGKGLRRRLVARYLRDLEADEAEFDRVAVLHRHTLQRLYALYHVKPSPRAAAVVVRGEAPSGSVFEVVRLLKTWSAEQIAAVLAQWRVPFLVALGALEQRAKEPEVLKALIAIMSPTDLTNFATTLAGLGVTAENPEVHALYLAALRRPAKQARPRATLKTTRAAAAVTDEKVKTAMGERQEQQIEASMAAVKGRWLVLGDKSGSMTAAIDVARQVAAILARACESVRLVFFDTAPRSYDVSAGVTLAGIAAATRGVSASGGTDIACGLQWAADNNVEVNGIAIVSDGGDYGMRVGQTYRRYCEKLGVEPTVYFYQTDGESDRLSSQCQAAGIDLQTYDLRAGRVDYHSLPNLVQTMRVGRYQLLDEVMATPLKTLDEVLRRTRGMAVLAQVQPQAVLLAQ
jgi:hypothetical protein